MKLGQVLLVEGDPNDYEFIMSALQDVGVLDVQHVPSLPFELKVLSQQSALPPPHVIVLGEYVDTKTAHGMLNASDSKEKLMDITIMILFTTMFPQDITFLKKQKIVEMYQKPYSYTGYIEIAQNIKHRLHLQ